MRRALLAVCALLVTTRTALALNPALDISQYVHSAWRTHDGFLNGGLRSIAQTPDGYLWLDRKVYDASSTGADALRLPPLTRDLQFEYTAVSLVAPEKNEVPVQARKLGP